MTYALLMMYVWGTQVSMVRLAEYESAEACGAAAVELEVQASRAGWPPTGIVDTEMQRTQAFCVAILSEGRRGS